MLHDVITATATIITATPVFEPTVVSQLGQVADPGAVIPASPALSELSQKLITDATALGTLIYGGIEAIDNKVVRLPGSMKSFLSWALSGVLPYVLYIWQAFSGVVVFDFNVLLMLAGATKGVAEGLHQATDKDDSVPVADMLSGWWNGRKKQRARAVKKPKPPAAPTPTNGGTT